MSGTKKGVKIVVLGDDSVIHFAADELRKYLGMMASKQAEITVETRNTSQHTGDHEISLGTFHDFALDTSFVEDLRMDDAIHIEIDHLRGRIAGTNARSVLLAVYRFLTESGCRWLTPGSLGEHVPLKDIGTLCSGIREKASYRHRGLCIEGAVSFENMLENIEWAPKAGFNGYFLEFLTPFTFFDRWYTHKNNKYKEPQPVSVEMVKEYTKALEAEIVKRGLLYHAVGHGWTCEPFGIEGLGWDPEVHSLTEETTRLFAQVNGKRELWNGVPLNTNLCYSNPVARTMMLDFMVAHINKNPHIDILHFWLADGSNNMCECENCKAVLPSDFYVEYLNELDERLTNAGSPVKIAFLAYVDLLWPPVAARLKQSDRFILMFAPISRTYSEPYDVSGSPDLIPPFVRNRLEFPSGVKENVSFLRGWQESFFGDGFAYEYYFMWDHYLDPGYYRTANIINQDIKKLRDLQLNGMVSDQTQRSFFPTGFGMYVMAKTLWDESAEFEELATSYFHDAFGEDGDLCRQYMARLSDLFNPPYLRGESPQIDPAAAESFEQISRVAEEFLPVIHRNTQNEAQSVAQSWKYLLIHSQLVVMLAEALVSRAKGQNEEAAALWRQIEDFVQKNEDAVQPVFDVFEFIETVGRRFVVHA